ncbi:MAG: hypothetical protein JOY84_01620 [Curvibacter sp.]|nr:hypothetical protein [Curvibacter sp.]
MRFSFLTLHVSLLLAMSSAFAGSAAPAFEDCAVPPESGPSPGRPPHLKLSDPKARRYASALQEGATQAINFAGHYILTTWGCGAGCLMAAAIDARSGQVAMLPFTVSDWPLSVSEPLSYRKDSCLLGVQGRRNEQAPGAYFYRFDGKRFRVWEPSRPTPSSGEAAS